MLRLAAGLASPVCRRLPPAASAQGGHGAADAALLRELVGCMASPLAPMQARWAKKSKRKRKAKKDDKTPEQKAANGSTPERPWDRYMMGDQTSFQVYRTLNQHMRRLASDGRWNVRRKKDMTSYTNYRLLRAAGLTHDTQKEEVDRRGFVTPLTELQDSSNLPRSPLHRRFLFPHTFHYKVYWGPPSVEEEPNRYEGSMVGCTVAARLDDLPLTHEQKERLVDIVGPDRVDERTGVVAIEADVFPERNHNASILGDMFEKLLREATTDPSEK